MQTTNATLITTPGSAGGSRRRHPARRGAIVLAAVAAATLSLTAPPALADACPNATLRAQNNSTQLPDCRAYEQVTPRFKEGLPPSPIGFTDSGRIAYLANGNYANNGNGVAGAPGGNAYLSDRSGSGWSIKALVPSGPEYHTYLNPAFPRAFSSDLSSSLWVARRGDETDAVHDLYLRRPDDAVIRVGSLGDPLAPASSAGNVLASDDLSHVAFSVGSGTYEYVRTGSDQPQLVSVDVDNAGQRLTPGCSTWVGYHAISADGRMIFLRCQNDAVYVRVDGTTTIDASESQCTRAPSDPGGACNADSGSVLEGASADGRRVYFTSSQQLVNGDADDTMDLYECDIPSGTPAPVGAVNPCPDLQEVSGAATGASVKGVTRISDDGTRAYFVATGVLASGPGANDVPAVAGDDNLYVWTRDAAHPAGETRFVAKLDPADGGLWGSDAVGRLAQATDDGRYLVFASYAALIDHGPQADTDAALDLYRYDAESGALTRLSTNADGAGGNEAQNAQITPNSYDQQNPNMRLARTVMSNDGGSVVFTTEEPLAPGDTNGTTDTYLWHEGRVSLISSGKPSTDANFPGSGDPLGTSTKVQALISPSGRDVYFTTTAQLIPGDTDTVFDIYDARVDGGLPPTRTPTPCSGDACQSPPSTQPPTSRPGSTTSTVPGGPTRATPAFSVKALTASQLRRVSSTGKVPLSITTNAPGMLSAQATATIAKRSGSVGSARRKVASAGTVSLSLTLSKKARAELKSKRKLTVKVLIRQDNVAIARTVSLKLTQPKAVKKAKKQSSRTASRHAAAKGDRS